MEQIDIIQQPQSQRIAEGSPVVLSCKAVGPVELQYQWFKGKDEVWGELNFLFEPTNFRGTHHILMLVL